MTDIFDKIDKFMDSWEFRKSSQLTAKITVINTQNNYNFSVKKLAHDTKLKETTVQRILAGTWKNHKDYKTVEKYLDSLIQK